MITSDFLHMIAPVFLAGFEYGLGIHIAQGRRKDNRRAHKWGRAFRG